MFKWTRKRKEGEELPLGLTQLLQVLLTRRLFLGLKFYVYTVKNAFLLGSKLPFQMRSPPEKESQKKRSNISKAVNQITSYFLSTVPGADTLLNKLFYRLSPLPFQEGDLSISEYSNHPFPDHCCFFTSLLNIEEGGSWSCESSCLPQPHSLGLIQGKCEAPTGL